METSLMLASTVGPRFDFQHVPQDAVSDVVDNLQGGH